jgi:hypothetical protein
VAHLTRCGFDAPDGLDRRSREFHRRERIRLDARNAWKKPTTCHQLPPSVVFFDGRLVRSLTRAVAQLHRTISLPNRFASRTMQCEALPSSSKNALLHARISLVMCTCND